VGTEILLEGFVSFLSFFAKDQSAPGGGFIFRNEGRLGSIPRAGTNFSKKLRGSELTGSDPFSLLRNLSRRLAPKSDPGFVLKSYPANSPDVP